MRLRIIVAGGVRNRKFAVAYVFEANYVDGCHAFDEFFGRTCRYVKIERYLTDVKMSRRGVEQLQQAAF